jgi:hypothetical protein
MTKAIMTRKINTALVLHAVESASGTLSVLEIAVKTKLTGNAVNMLLNDLEMQRKITRYGSRLSRGSVRFGPFVMPEVRVHEFRPWRPQKQTVVPIRDQGRMAPNIYEGVIFKGASK